MCSLHPMYFAFRVMHCSCFTTLEIHFTPRRDIFKLCSTWQRSTLHGKEHFLETSPALRGIYHSERKLCERQRRKRELQQGETRVSISYQKMVSKLYGGVMLPLSIPSAQHEETTKPHGTHRKCRKSSCDQGAVSTSIPMYYLFFRLGGDHVSSNWVTLMR